MIFSHVLSEAVLAGTGFGVFWYYYQRVARYNRLLWGFFLLTISLAAVAGLLWFAGYEAIEQLYHSLITLAGSLGIVSVVTAVWALLNNLTVGVTSFAITLVLGLVLFVVLRMPPISAFAPVVTALSILIVMLMAVYGLMHRNPRSVWIIFAVMLLGLATKAPSFYRFIHPTDFYHYAVALSLLCFGKAIDI